MKNLLYILGAIILVGAIAGGYFFPRVTSLFGSPTGATFNTVEYKATIVAPATASATSTSIQNTTGSDLLIRQVNIGCGSVGTSKTPLTGAGLAAFTVAIATSSTNAPAINANTNYVGGAAITLSTSTVDLVISSSTPVLGSVADSNRWLAGSYLTFSFDATNTAACTVGVNVIPQ